MTAAKFMLLALLLVSLQINAQEATEAAAAASPTIPADDFDRGTPVRSIEGFLAAADRGDFETAAAYLDLRNLRGAASEQPEWVRRAGGAGLFRKPVDDQALIDALHWAIAERPN